MANFKDRKNPGIDGKELQTGPRLNGVYRLVEK